MNSDEIIRLAKEVGYPLVSIGGYPYIPPLLAVLLEAAVEAERDAICPIVYGRCGSDNDAQRIVDAIRARGEK